MSAATVKVETVVRECGDDWDTPVAVSAAAMSAKRVNTTRRPQPSTIRPLDSDGFVWPCLDESALAQLKHAPPQHTNQNGEGLWTLTTEIWIPGAERQLIERLLVISHCGAQCHRGIEVMSNQLQAVLSLSNQTETIRRFATSVCCVSTRWGGGRQYQDLGAKPTMRARDTRSCIGTSFTLETHSRATAVCS